MYLLTSLQKTTGTLAWKSDSTSEYTAKQGEKKHITYESLLQ